MSKAIEDVMFERARQKTVEGWTPEHDDGHIDGEMARAAACYAHNPGKHKCPCPASWPWTRAWWKPTDTRRDLVKAGALIIAEIERLDRKESQNV